MYNISLKVDITDATTPSTIIYKDVVVKITADNMTTVKNKIKTIYELSSSDQIIIKAIGYVQEILTNSEE